MADFKTPYITAQEHTTGLTSSPDVVGRVKTALIDWTKTAAQTDGDEIFLMPVLSTDRIIGLYTKNDALTGATDLNFGFWTAASTPVIVGTGNQIGDAVSIASAATVWTQRDELAPEDVGKTVWELLGLTGPVDRTYYLTAMLVTGGTAGGDVKFRVDFLI